MPFCWQDCFFSRSAKRQSALRTQELSRPLVAWQVLRYMVRIWEREWRQERRLFPIVPVVACATDRGAVFMRVVSLWRGSGEAVFEGLGELKAWPTPASSGRGCAARRPWWFFGPGRFAYRVAWTAGPAASGGSGGHQAAACTRCPSRRGPSPIAPRPRPTGRTVSPQIPPNACRHARFR